MRFITMLMKPFKSFMNMLKIHVRHGRKISQEKSESIKLKKMILTKI